VYEKYKKLILGSLFGIQIIGATTFCVTQSYHSLTDVRGVSAAQFAMFALFAGINLWLALDAFGTTPKSGRRDIWKLLATYIIWSVGALVVTSVVVANPKYQWGQQDLYTFGSTAVLSAFVGLYAWRKGWTITNPQTKGCLAVVFKAIPQFFLVWKIGDEGGSGFPLWTMLAGHLTICTRLVQIHLTTSGLTYRWLTISEGANWISWIVVTLFWVVAMGYV
jgi:hypothetical protein